MPKGKHYVAYSLTQASSTEASEYDLEGLGSAKMAGDVADGLGRIYDMLRCQ